MSDPIGLIGHGAPLPPDPSRVGAGRPGRDGPDFMQLLQQQIDRVSELQQDASAATEDLLAGRRNDVESVMMAARKADTAFRTLLQVRNRMMEAYDEVKQIRV